MAYRPIDGESVSSQWLVVLKAMRAAGVDFNVNEGHRTFARQWELYRLWKAGKGNLAAYPSPTAPHIRTGRIDHAIDFSNDGAVFRWLSNHGLHPVRTVRGESWHIESPASLLRAFAKLHGDPLRGLHRAERRIAERVIYHRKKARRSKGARRTAQLKWMRWWKRRLRKQMNRIMDAARKAGDWNLHNRDRRYQLLGAVYEAKGEFK